VEKYMEDIEKSAPEAPRKRHRTMLMSGNEAIARGAWEAGVHVACGYPGTPSTEIMEAVANFPEVNCEWSTNEKVALEVAIGAAIAGGRALATMKHVGLNVAADPFFSVAYTGNNGGLVVVSADDPGMHSSQNEQDNRLLARAARVPMLEPATPQEARDYTRAAFEISERFDAPVLLRSTTRVSHGKGEVEPGGRQEAKRKPYRKQPAKYVVLPAHGRVHHKRVELERLPELELEAEKWATLHEGSDELALITGGAAFLYVREAFPRATILKLGMTHPLPRQLIKEFAAGKQRLMVVEELEPYLEEQVRSLGIACEGKEQLKLPRYGELSVELLRQAVLGEEAGPAPVELPPLPPRPPVLCAGCSHRGTFYVLKQLDAIVSGDIGCYTLGALAPLDAMDTCINMGASVAMAHGMEKVMSEEERRRLVSVIGDSTFYHSGLPGLVDVLYNGGHSTTIILDNHTTAMTGHQAHPGSGDNIRGEPANVVQMEPLCKGLGIDNVRHTDAYDLLQVWRTLDEELHRDAPSVVLAEAPCVLHRRTRFGEPISLDLTRCTECLACTQVGCPAIELKGGQLEVNQYLCIACSHCQQVCADCNAGIDIPQVLELTHQKRYADAFRVLLRASPFPAVAGRVCPHPCDHEINALGYPQERIYAERYPEMVRDFPTPGRPSKLSVRDVERFLGDYGIENFTGAEFMPEREREEKVAVVGAGPGGLAAAWHLRRQGFAVTVYETFPEPGGMLRYGIPEFRLPREVLDAEIDRLYMVGVDIRCGVEVGKDFTFHELCEAHDAVVVAAGDSAPQELTLDGTGDIREGLLYGVDFLRRVNRHLPVKVGNRVAVIGGGNTAIDCARSARRLGAEVTVYYRRDENEMPAIREEIDDAVADDVRFEFRVNPVRVAADDGKVRGLELTRMKPGPLDSSGRRRPRPIPGSEFEVPVDNVILAVGERADLQFLADSGVAYGNEVEVRFSGATSRADIFACGDVAFGHGTVTQAISTGRRVAEAVLAHVEQQKGRS
jgi:indolepyruvate ferredoxin oxidoreductase alpha subunit